MKFFTNIILIFHLFTKKTKDYGTAWRILRPSSLTDQLLIKAFRIRSIEELGAGKQKIDESVDVEYIGLVNYGLMALIPPMGSFIELSSNSGT